MNTIKKRNRIVLCLCSILVMFASIFAFIPLVKNDKMVVKADSVTTTYDFQSSYLFYPTAYFVNNGNSFICQQFNNFVKFRFHFYSYADGYYHFEFDDLVIYNVNAVDNSQMYSYSCLARDNDTGQLYDTITFDNTNLRWFYLFTNESETLQYPWYSFGLFNMQVSSMNLSPNFISLTLKTTTYNSDYNFVNLVYKDSNGESLTINIAYSIKDTTSTIYTLSERTYYFANPNNFIDNEYYNSGYQSGKQEGYNNGYSVGNSEGYSNGYQTGKDDGYWLGYNQALENDDRYTFTNLISSVIDVPVKTFTSLFNFEIFGVNLSGFFLGLLTCCIVICVIRLIL